MQSKDITHIIVGTLIIISLFIIIVAGKDSNINKEEKIFMTAYRATGRELDICEILIQDLDPEMLFMLTEKR